MTIDADWLDVAALVALVSLAAFFAASEAALISVSRLRALAMVERGVKRAKSVVSLIEDRNRFLTSVLIANTVVPWATLWLYFFEEWLVSDDWKGGGVHPNEDDPEGSRISEENPSSKSPSRRIRRTA